MHLRQFKCLPIRTVPKCSKGLKCKGIVSNLNEEERKKKKGKERRNVEDYHGCHPFVPEFYWPHDQGKYRWNLLVSVLRTPRGGLRSPFRFLRILYRHSRSRTSFHFLQRPNGGLRRIFKARPTKAIHRGIAMPRCISRTYIHTRGTGMHNTTKQHNASIVGREFSLSLFLCLPSSK